MGHHVLMARSDQLIAGFRHPPALQQPLRRGNRFRLHIEGKNLPLRPDQLGQKMGVMAIARRGIYRQISRKQSFPQHRVTIFDRR